MYNIMCRHTTESDTPMSIPTHYELTCMRDNERSILSCDGTITLTLTLTLTPTLAHNAGDTVHTIKGTSLIHVHIHTYIRMYVCMYVCTSNVCTHIHGYISTVCTHIGTMHKYVCMYREGTQVQRISPYTHLYVTDYGCV